MRGLHSINRALTWTILFLLPVCLFFVIHYTVREQPGQRADSPATIHTHVEQAALEEIEAHILRTIAEQRSHPEVRLPEKPSQGPVYVALRSKGLRRGEAWSHVHDWNQGIREAILNACAAARIPDLEGIDAVEVCLTHSYRRIELPRDRDDLTDIHRGICGLEVSRGAKQRRYGPTEMLARNLDFANALRTFAEDNDIPLERLESEDGGIRMFAGCQVLVKIDQGISVTPMFRGNEIVPLREVTQERVQRLCNELQNWLMNQVHADGRITYKYWPSRGEESQSNNMIRQFMASVCLARMAQADGAKRALDLHGRNLAYNFEKFYRVENDLGLIEYDGTVKLGAVAIAATAILESPFASQYLEAEKRLDALIRHQWQPDGSFRTFYIPAERNDCQNFYPGEALLYWALRYRETRNPEILEQFMRSFRYYSQWHLREENRNPAFVPWHTQAYFAVWQLTHDKDLEEFILTMNDWLLEMQQWDNVPYADVQGRFYNPEKPEYGPPHVSSTGVYLEGLIDAFALARTIGDAHRADAYRRSIVRGLRSVLQLEFADEVDMYYVSKPERVRGALRTNVYDNEVRIDNVQHVLMAVMRILDEFGEEDYGGGQD